MKTRATTNPSSYTPARPIKVRTARSPLVTGTVVYILVCAAAIAAVLLDLFVWRP